MSEPNNPYAVERTTFQYGRSSQPAELPDDLTIVLVRLSGTEYFEMFVNGEQAGAYNRNDDFVAKAAEFAAVTK